MKEFFRDGIVVLVGLLAANALTYAYYSSVTHAVGVAHAGAFTSLVAAILLLSLPANVTGAVIAKVAADERARCRPAALRWLSAASTGAVVLSGAAAAAACAWWTRDLQVFFHVDDAGTVIFAAVSFAVSFPLPMQRAVLQGAGNFGGFVLSNCVEALVKAVAGAAVLVWHLGVREALAGYAIAGVGALVATAVLGMHGGREFRAPALSRRLAAGHLLGVAIPVAAITSVTFTDVVLVQHFLGPRLGGLYGAAALVGRAILTIVQFVPIVLMPKAVAAVAAGKSPRQLLIGAAIATLGATSAIIVVTAVAPSLVITVIAGAKFLGAVPLLLPYAVAMSALAGATVLANYLIALGRRGFAGPLTAAAAVEIATIATYHPSVSRVVLVVVAGHLGMLTATLVDTAGTLQSVPHGSALLREGVERARI